MKPINEQLDPILATDDQILDTLSDSDTASIMLCMVHLTGDMGIIRGAVNPIMEFLAPGEGITAQERQQVLHQALDVLKGYRDVGLSGNVQERCQFGLGPTFYRS